MLGIRGRCIEADLASSHATLTGLMTEQGRFSGNTERAVVRLIRGWN